MIMKINSCEKTILSELQTFVFQTSHNILPYYSEYNDSVVDGLFEKKLFDNHTLETIQVKALPILYLSLCIKHIFV